MKIKIDIGNSQLEFEVRDIKDIFRETGAFTQIGFCGICKSKNLGLEYRKVKSKNKETEGQEFEYYAVICNDCNSKAHLGEYKGGGFYLKRWEKFDYNKNNNQHGSNEPAFNDVIPY